uniref:SFRICE_020401 n=1 Tax=Spodoptera frugiperda TaxID=7108 RepID=A0A2H1VT02_SPOFR
MFFSSRKQDQDVSTRRLPQLESTSPELPEWQYYESIITVLTRNSITFKFQAIPAGSDLGRGFDPFDPGLLSLKLDVVFSLNGNDVSKSIAKD